MPAAPALQSSGTNQDLVPASARELQCEVGLDLAVAPVIVFRVARVGEMCVHPPGSVHRLSWCTQGPLEPGAR